MTDIVVTWVDGSDAAWRKSFAATTGQEPDGMRWRDWGLMRYWFRAIERNAPWARKIHFVTCGQVPDWLDATTGKLHVVRHEEFIPHDCLPTFNSCAIEVYLHRIPELSSQFVYFNDDMFATSALLEEDFFHDGLPCDCATLESIRFCEGAVGDAVGENIKWINAVFSADEIYRRNLAKLVSPRIGFRHVLRNLAMMALCRNFIPGFANGHLPVPLLKRTFDDVWRRLPEVMAATGQSRLRAVGNVSQWLFRNWQLACGWFHPKRSSGRYFAMKDGNIDDIRQAIIGAKYPTICLNDVDQVSNVATARRSILDAFQTAFPYASSFEKEG